MHIDPFSHEPIHAGQVWTTTGCLHKEQQINQSIGQQLARLGYQSDRFGRHWYREDHKVVLCLVDDIATCSDKKNGNVFDLFDVNTLVITDNFIPAGTQYKVLRLPDSFFSIYCHEPQDVWQPDRHFSFAVNRLDHRRLCLFLEIACQTSFDQGYVNFNCFIDQPHGKVDVSTAQLMENFDMQWSQVQGRDRQKYQRVFEHFKQEMPFRNYGLHHDAIFTRSFCNIVIETYGSDSTVALSEKIFRALVLPVPWTLFGGRGAIDCLESIGFDCLQDIVPHQSYDWLYQTDDRICAFVNHSLSCAQHLSLSGNKQIKDRCEIAAQNNRLLLKSWQSRWPHDLDQWMINLENILTNRWSI